MGKMIGAQSIIVACVATGLEGKEGDVFRAVLKHSIALALLIGLIVMFFAYAAPGWVPNGQNGDNVPRCALSRDIAATKEKLHR